MATKITTKVKDKVWKDYTKNSKSKNELKQMFLGLNPTDAYKKISIKLKKKIDQIKASPKKTLKPSRTKIRSSPSRTKIKSSPSRVRLIKN
jgi:hypothetical protein